MRKTDISKAVSGMLTTHPLPQTEVGLKVLSTPSTGLYKPSPNPQKLAVSIPPAKFRAYLRKRPTSHKEK